MKNRKPPYILIAVLVILVSGIAILNAGSNPEAARALQASNTPTEAGPATGSARSTPSKGEVMGQVQMMRKGKKTEINFDEPLIIKPEAVERTLKPAENLPTGQWYNRKG